MNAVSCLRRCARLSKERAVHNLDSIQSSTAVNLMWPAQHWINGDNSSHWKRANFDRLLVLVMMQLCTNELCSSPCRCSTVIRAFQRYARTDCLSQYVYIAFINYHQDQAIGRKLICRMTKGIFLYAEWYIRRSKGGVLSLACWRAYFFFKFWSLHIIGTREAMHFTFCTQAVFFTCFLSDFYP